MKKVIVIISLVLFCQFSYGQAVVPGDWSRIREYGHSYNLNDFSDDEYQWIKNHYNLFTIEKRHAKYVYGDVSSERASTATAAKIIADNSTAEPIFYWNIKVVYDGIYETIQAALAEHPDWVTEDGGTWVYDDPDMKQWTIDILTEYVEQGHAGVFLDQVMAFPGEKEDILEIMNSTPGIVIYNGFTPRGTEDRPVIAATMEYLNNAEGVYVEHFLHGSHCKYLSQGKSLMDSLLVVPNDKIIIAMSGLDTTYWNAPDHKFSLAAYLIIANDNSYYHYLSNGLLASDYMMEQIDDFDKYLGPPKAKAAVNGYVYTRSFENAEVTLDLENKTSSIVWGSLTGPVNSSSSSVTDPSSSSSDDITNVLKQIDVNAEINSLDFKLSQSGRNLTITSSSANLYQVEAFNILGNKLQSQTKSGGVESMNLSVDLGISILRIKTTSGSILFKKVEVQK